MAVNPCQHVCVLADLDYRKVHGKLKSVVCGVCGRTWSLSDGVPSKGWPPRWFINCPPKGKVTDKVKCRVASCNQSIRK